MYKITQRTFIESEEVETFLTSRGLNMVAGEEAKGMEGCDYLGMDFMLLRIDSGLSKGKLEVVRFDDLPKGIKDTLKDHLMELFNK